MNSTFSPPKLKFCFFLGVIFFHAKLYSGAFVAKCDTDPGWGGRGL